MEKIDECCLRRSWRTVSFCDCEEHDYAQLAAREPEPVEHRPKVRAQHAVQHARALIVGE
jgi:hypothetical protein